MPKIAAATGGGYFELTSARDLASTFTRVADELHHQYALGFTPEKLDGKMHDLTVRVPADRAGRAGAQALHGLEGVWYAVGSDVMRAGLVLLVLAGLAMAASPRGQSGESVHITTAARSVQPGEVVVLTAVTPDTAETLRVRAFGRDIPAFPVDAHTWRALIGIDLDVRAGRYEAAVDARSGSRTWHATTPLMVLARTFSTRKLRVDPAFVNPPREAEARIVQEAKQLEALWSASSSSRLWDGAFVQPVPGAGPVASAHEASSTVSRAALTAARTFRALRGRQSPRRTPGWLFSRGTCISPATRW